MVTDNGLGRRWRGRFGRECRRRRCCCCCCCCSVVGRDGRHRATRRRRRRRRAEADVEVSGGVRVYVIPIRRTVARGHGPFGRVRRRRRRTEITITIIHTHRRGVGRVGVRVYIYIRIRILISCCVRVRHSSRGSPNCRGSRLCRYHRRSSVT